MNFLKELYMLINIIFLINRQFLKLKKIFNYNYKYICNNVYLNYLYRGHSPFTI